jgi:hypothetical protein
VIVPQSGHDRFLPKPLKFIIHQPSYHPALYSLDKETPFNNPSIIFFENVIFEQATQYT